ncbi:MAG: WD40/YVTN/BNR-like repeat-containing protein [Actinomycetota bacterium]
MAGIAVGTENGLWSLDWQGSGRGPVSVFARHRVSALGQDDRVLLALLDGQTLWAGPLDGGNEEDWSPLASLEEMRGTCVAGTRAGVLVGTAQARLLRLEDGVLNPLDGFDAAEGRADWYTPWGGPPDTRSISENGHAVLVSVHVGGVLRSSDGGTSWMPTIDIGADVHRIVAHPRAPGRIYAACARGLAVSHDGGDSWTVSAEGLHARYCRGVAVTGDHVLVSASEGPGGLHSALYRGAPDGSGLQRCRAGLPDWFGENIDSLSLDASSTTGLAAFGTATGRVFVSEDDGATWELAADRLPPVTCVAVT